VSATITTERLTLEPLRPEDADELTPVLDDVGLHEFIGGRPATLAELREHYTRLAAGSSKPDEVWLNWIVRRRADSQPVGTMQATLRDGRRSALLAWVIGVQWQNQGFASEAALGLVEWLRAHGVLELSAHIHPEHAASAAVARRAGLEPTDREIGGERIWRSP
jgi:RimJ/RimL family protein N-acetyltransferase